MAKEVGDWVNNVLHLSRNVSDFEREFSNGFLLGEILFKLGLQTDFASFKDVTTPKEMLANYTRLVRVTLLQRDDGRASLVLDYALTFAPTACAHIAESDHERVGYQH